MIAGLFANLFPLARPLLHALDPETAHELTIKGLAALPPASPPADDPRLAVELFGRRIANPVGLAAGFDKQAEAVEALFSLGFGLVELGGVVPRPQPGNPKPRLFRLTGDRAVINRFGLNSEGLEAVRARLERRPRAGWPGFTGVNIGANKDSADRIADYAACARGLSGLVDFLTVNVSSPNTPGLRDLQGEAFLDELLARVMEVAGPTLVFLKIAPDLSLDGLDAITATALRRGIHALVVSNTTLARPGTLRERALAAETGGLSGRPLFAASTRLLAEAYLRVGGRLALVGVGGVDSGEAAWTKVRAGASLLQLYTALVYHGPGLVGAVKRDLVARLAGEDLPSLAGVVGRDAARIAAGDLG